MVHLIKIAVLASAAAILPALAAPALAAPALAAPVNATNATNATTQLVAREPEPRRNLRATASNVANRIRSVVSRVGSTANRIGSVARRVNSAVSRITSLFGRDLEPEEELYLRELLEDLHARSIELDFDEFDAREPGFHPRELDDELEAREEYYDELD
jgi:hypothetical protein